MAGMIVVEDEVPFPDHQHQSGQHPPPDGNYIPNHLMEVSCPLFCKHEVRLLFQPVLSYDNFITGFALTQRLIEDNELFRFFPFLSLLETKHFEKVFSAGIGKKNCR